ncbi:cytochrome c [Halomonas sp. JS92-SW72]|uniref:SorU family sulfite dehydrogenase c-type cytochrome subunit n=1 Tax=Halomonas sp. JS92-SW72 TaxID=2306583 RepID=UPI000E5B5498|nr:cytochrome c [Halomonas sp. JS92-SW72]AXY41402.1 cytochrome c [Halomonas sp. JS92-SW72]
MARPRISALAAVILLAALPVAADETLTLGKQVFTETATPSCTICHTLQDAGSSGAIGPNLDELKPSAEAIRAAVARGVGVMPAYEEALSSEQIDAVARYVSYAHGGE